MITREQLGDSDKIKDILVELYNRVPGNAPVQDNTELDAIKESVNKVKGDVQQIKMTLGRLKKK